MKYRISISLGEGVDHHGRIDWEPNTTDGSEEPWIAFQSEPGFNQRSRRPDLDNVTIRGIMDDMLVLIQHPENAKR